MRHTLSGGSTDGHALVGTASLDGTLSWQADNLRVNLSAGVGIVITPDPG